MLQVPSQVWNEIAETQPLETKWAQLMFPLDDEAMEQVVDHHGQLMSKAGHPSKVTVAYHEMLPLLLEYPAISAWISQTGALEMRQALPEVASAAQAVGLATAEHRLTPSQADSLTELLTFRRGESNGPAAKAMAMWEEAIRAHQDGTLSLDE